MTCPRCATADPAPAEETALGAPGTLPGAAEAEATARRARADGLALTRRALLVGGGGAVVVACTPGDGGVPLFMVSPAEEQRMGVEAWQRIRAEERLSNNQGMRNALDRVGGRILAAVGQNPAQWEMRVFQGDSANAFALPGGKIGVYEGIFGYMENDAQLATVIGHEIGHNQERHAAERLSTVQATNLGLQAIGIALQQGNIGYANQIMGLLGAGAQYGVVLPYGRQQELEADRRGLFNMARAGFDPRESIPFWGNMQSAGNRPPAFLSTHPAPGDRIAQLQSLMPQALSVYQA
ncbi:MAG: M48 family metallopeptidase [Azospirillaceae bacterium]